MRVRDILLAESYRCSDAAGIVVMIASGGYLVISVSVQFPVCLDSGILLIKYLFIIPITLYYGLWHLLEKLIRFVFDIMVIPQHIIRPYP